MCIYVKERQNENDKANMIKCEHLDYLHIEYKGIIFIIDIVLTILEFYKKMSHASEMHTEVFHNGTLQCQ